MFFAHWHITVLQSCYQLTTPHASCTFHLHLVLRSRTVSKTSSTSLEASPLIFPAAQFETLPFVVVYVLFVCFALDVTVQKLRNSRQLKADISFAQGNLTAVAKGEICR